MNLTSKEAPRVALYEWNTGDDFLIRHLFPEAAVVPASLDDTYQSLARGLPEDLQLFAPHLNCTLTAGFPRERSKLLEELRARGVHVLNERVTDISKKSLQATCARAGLPTTKADSEGDPDETLIVKTNLNFGGATEWALSSEERVELGLGMGSDIIWKPDHYQVLPRKEVERKWWTDENLIIERFIENRSDIWYRAFLIFDRVFLTELKSPGRIKKVWDSELTGSWKSGFGPEWQDTIPDSGPAGQILRDLALYVSETGLEFGAVDFVLSEQGRPFLIDLNSTPAYHYPLPGLVEHLRNDPHA